MQSDETHEPKEDLEAGRTEEVLQPKNSAPFQKKVTPLYQRRAKRDYLPPEATRHTRRRGSRGGGRILGAQGTDVVREEREKVRKTRSTIWPRREGPSTF